MNENESNLTAISDEVRRRIESVRNKRARFVLDQILKNGSVSTEEISRAGYDHPPRAAQDVKDLGFPLIRDKLKHSNGRTIASYRLDLDKLQTLNMDGRKLISKKLREEVLDDCGRRCKICSSALNLQIDHRIPYQVAGETENRSSIDFQALCGSCNRKKSWACEDCPNFLAAKDASICQTCYWFGTGSYAHIATMEERRAEVVWTGDHEVQTAEALTLEATKKGRSLPEHIKVLLDRWPK